MTKKSAQKGDVKSAEPVTPTVKCEPNYSFGEDHPYYESLYNKFLLLPTLFDVS